MPVNLDKFLIGCRPKGGRLTHTAMPGKKGSKQKGGSYTITGPEKVTDFFELYHEQVFVHNIPTHINELPEPNRRSPLKVDLDFRYVQDKKGKPERRYNLIMLCTIIQMFYDVFKEWLVCPIDDDQAKCFVFERKNAKYKDKQEGLVKDGIHLVWPYLVCPFSFQQIVRTEMLKKLKNSGIFTNMKLYKQTMSDVYDKGVVEGSWMMYGSCKPKHKPYKLTHILQYTIDEDESEDIEDLDIDWDTYTNKFLTRVLSMRNRTDSLATFQIHKEKEIAALETKAMQIKDEKLKKKLAYKATNTEKTDKDLEIIFGLIDILNPKRADNYGEWIQFVWCCHNIHNTDDRLLIKAIEFSKKSEKYSAVAEDSCRNAWNEAKDDGLQEGSLYMWAKEDNYEEYNKVLRKTIWGKVKKCAVSPYFNPYEVAEIAYDMYSNNYICVDVVKNVWYRFQKQRWKQEMGAISLKKNISTEVFENFAQKPSEYMTQDEMNSTNKWKALYKNASQLRQTSFKENVIKECKQFFNDPDNKFMENLDERRNLIAFENGVLDLDDENLLFRNGRPDDYISMSTKINYSEFSWDDPTVVEIMELIKKILPNKNVREFVLTLCSSFLHGSVKAEKFYFWTGSGGNGKSTLTDLIDKTFGDYSGDMPVQILTSGRQKPGEANAEIARLKGVRAVFVQEPEEGKSINASLLKQFSGGDKVTARQLYGNPFDFTPQWKIVTCCNDLPKLPPMDGGVWRRVRVVHFGSKFVDYPDERDPTQFKKDESLKDKFDTYAEPFMWILIQYFKIYMKEGLKEPEEVTKQTKAYQAEMDRFQEWINADVVRTFNKDEHRLKKKDAHATYMDWMNENYSGNPKLQLSDFVKLMNKKFNMKYHDSYRVKMENGRRITGKNADGWWGYLLKKDYVRLGYNTNDENDSDNDDDDIDSLSETISVNEKQKKTPNTTSILNEMNKVIKTTGKSSTNVEDELIQGITTSKEDDLTGDNSEDDSEDNSEDNSEDDSEDDSV
jgi:P4 family phage/plasmid primase-like protien